MIDKNIFNEIIIKDAKILDLLTRMERNFGYSFCRTNIYKTYILIWNDIYNDIIQYLCSYKYDYKCKLCYSKEELIDKIFNINDICNEFLIKNKLANLNFTNFYSKFNYHLLLTQKEYLKKIILNFTEDSDLKSAISSITFIITENILNTIRVELEGIDIFCEYIGNQAMCKDKVCKALSKNIITLYVNDMYLKDEIFDKIILAFDLIKDKYKILLIVDYRNIINNYNWEEIGAYKRYNIAKKYIEHIYFDYVDNVNFGKYYDELKSYIINSEDEYNMLINSWVKDKKPIIFR